MMRPEFTPRISDLDRRVNIETRSVTRDPVYGSQVETWTAATQDTWAAVLQSSTAAGILPNADDNVASYARPTKVWLRWRSGIDRQDHRVRLSDGQLLRIIGTAELGRQEWLELSCLEWAHE